MKAQKEIPLADMTYEQAFSELEVIVNALENQQKSLDESLKLFERGQILVKHCSTLLDKADLRVRTLNPDLTTEDGEV